MKMERKFTTWNDAYNYCRKINTPLITEVQNEVAKISPNGEFESIYTIPASKSPCIFTKDNGLEFLSLKKGNVFSAWITWYGAFQEGRLFYRRDYADWHEIGIAMIRWFNQHGMGAKKG